MDSDRKIDAVASALYGLRPFEAGKDMPKDVGLGGPSAEYLAGAQDPWGNEFNYPRIWWMNGEPVLLSEEEAYKRALEYESATGQYFPRYRNSEASTFAAQNRSAMGGAELGPLATMLPARNF
jgi:hypothetical protein